MFRLESGEGEGHGEDEHGENELKRDRKRSVPSLPSDEPEGFRKYKRIVVAAILGVAAVVFATLFSERGARSDGWLALHHPHVLSWLLQVAEIIDKLGDALLIAAVIGYCIDVAIKHELIEEVVRAASPELLGRHLPPDVRRALVGMFEMKFVRAQWTVEYELTPVEGRTDLLQVKETIGGVVMNCGRNQETYTLVTSVDPSFLEGGPESEISRLNVGPEFGTSLIDEHPENQEQPDKTKVASYPFDIPPRRRYETKVELTEYRPMSFILPLFTATTVAKTVLKIRYPMDLLDLHVSTGTSDSLPPKNQTKLGKEWEITTPLLPGQCVITRWLPKPPHPGTETKPGPEDPAARTGAKQAAPAAEVTHSAEEKKTELPKAPGA
jgi:hypothetical protein